MNRKVKLSVIVALHFTTLCLSQNDKDSIIYIKNLPSEKTFIKVYTEKKLGTIAEPPGFLSIFSTKENVLSAEACSVVKVFNNKGLYMVITKTKKSRFLSYDNLSSVNVKKGMYLASGDCIGKANKDDNLFFRLNFVVTLPSKKITYEEMLNYYINRKIKK